MTGKNYLAWLGERKNRLLFSIQDPTLRDACPSTSSGLAPQGERLWEKWLKSSGKRVIKAPKLYFFDVGLVSYLLGIETVSQLSRDPLRGHLFENLVVLECMKYRMNRCLEPHLYYFRDSHQNEVDLIYKKGHELVPIEIKSAESADLHFVKSLNYFQQLAPNQVSTGYIIYAGQLEYQLNGFELRSYKHVTQLPW